MKTFLLIIFSIFILTKASFALKENNIETSFMGQTLVGSVRSIGLNSVDIDDEQDKRVKRFRYPWINNGQWREGDRVRIYYRPDGIIERIRKMSIVAYKKDGQNTGYLYKK